MIDFWIIYANLWWLRAAIGLAILISVAFDALRDKWIKYREGSWWRWHIVKWISKFLLWGIMTIMFIPWYLWIPLAYISRILWKSLNHGKVELWVS